MTNWDDDFDFDDKPKPAKINAKAKAAKNDYDEIFEDIEQPKQIKDIGLPTMHNKDSAKKVKFISPEQFNQPTVDEGAEAQAKITAGKSKSKLRPFKQARLRAHDIPRP